MSDHDILLVILGIVIAHFCWPILKYFWMFVAKIRVVVTSDIKQYEAGKSVQQIIQPQMQQPIIQQPVQSPVVPVQQVLQQPAATVVPQPPQQ